jgi:hypothetical protein
VVLARRQQEVRSVRHAVDHADGSRNCAWNWGPSLPGPDLPAGSTADGSRSCWSRTRPFATVLPSQGPMEVGPCRWRWGIRPGPGGSGRASPPARTGRTRWARAAGRTGPPCNRARASWGEGRPRRWARLRRTPPPPERLPARRSSFRFHSVPPLSQQLERAALRPAGRQGAYPQWTVGLSKVTPPLVPSALTFTWATSWTTTRDPSVPTSTALKVSVAVLFCRFTFSPSQAAK